MSSKRPFFTVVGHTNEGKSSVVSTLAADDSVTVSDAPRTTTACREFPVRIDDEVIFTLIDSPGFENARKVLRWLKRNETTPDKRPQVVASFVEAHRDDPSFLQECRLLRPIVEGAGILYVIDGSHEFRPRWKAEMEVLRWTGQPRMALINDKDSGQFVDEWKAALNQYFNLVRYFNAHRSGFANRVALLRSLRELREEWAGAIDRAIAALEEDRRRKRRDAAALLARLHADILTHVERRGLPRGANVTEMARDIEGHFHDALRKREQACRRDVEILYDHHLIEREESDLARPVFDEDLFSESTWRALGLSTRQLLMAGAVGGATVGGTIDAFVGGASFLTGTVIGGVLGAGSAWYYASRRYASVLDAIRSLRGRDEVSIGPHKNPQLPWIVLDRALLHYAHVSNRAHGNRERLRLRPGERQGLVGGFPAARRKLLEDIFRRLRKAPGQVDPDLVGRLAAAIGEILADEETLAGAVDEAATRVVNGSADGA